MTKSARHVEVIYCDDIRNEIGGKISLMGIYAGDMIVPSIPLILPKLCIVITVITESSDPFQKLSARIERGEDRAILLSTGNIDITPLPAEEGDGNGNRLHVVQLQFVLSPFQVDGPTVLRVTVETERGPIRGRGLRIQLPPTLEDTRSSVSSEEAQPSKARGPAKSGTAVKTKPKKRATTTAVH